MGSRQEAAVHDDQNKETEGSSAENEGLPNVGFLVDMRRTVAYIQKSSGNFPAKC